MIRFTGRIDMGVPHPAHVEAKLAEKHMRRFTRQAAYMGAPRMVVQAGLRQSPRHVFVMTNTREGVAMVTPDLLLREKPAASRNSWPRGGVGQRSRRRPAAGR